ncbi:potassium transporter [Coccomyxa subellipsoidea C-169]|uniref:Potassium transporter n=1 Tax=Coccomyxa subellipsoidea (strain C-169) TaxID=574566 RepID=I0Z1I4_COCSC|nr:potassium transporter [Coccomyxa subellipsoidea C-169]EIE24503.1 potassium transporter [Coccomyxa subellipsoidea C-169]|eukprot:XP_005649047.1 potassium transporter [Coccomyxa subellipsoidea C-169]
MKRSLTDLIRKKEPGRQGFADSILSRVTSKAWENDADIEDPGAAERSGKAKWRGTLILGFQALGVVYGDIGTSPLYVISSTFLDGAPSEEDIVGVISLIIWSLTALLVIKYAAIVLRADDNGQGGTFALYSLLKRQAELGNSGKLMESDRHLSQYSIGRGDTRLASRLSRRKRTQSAPPGGLPTVTEYSTKLVDWRQRFIENRHTQNILRVLVVAGVGMIMGDGVLTPAISVVSACEGLQQASANITRSMIVIIAIVILAGLFMIQQFGTKFVGYLFSPIILVWFLFNSVVGIYNIAKYRPVIFKAFGPNYWFSFFLRNQKGGWQALGGVVLCITGVEALFADLGHFNRPSIQISTFCIVYPALIITYLGQGSYLLAHPDAFDAMFWKSLPQGTFWPMFVVATLAAIIASQALISAVFQIVSQAIVQGFFPRFHVYHTSREHRGQVYIPLINYLLMALCLIIVGTFQTSTNIGRAYGISVLADMFLTTHFMTLVLMTIWRLPLPLVVLWYCVFAPIEATYLSSALEKIPTGGWFSVMMSGIYTCIMLLWFWGNSKKKAFYGRKKLKLHQFLALMGDDGKDEQTSMTIASQKIALKASATKLKRVRGVGLYYGEDIHGVPPVLLQMVSRTPVLYEVNIFVTNRFVPIPEVLPSERILVEQLGVSGFYHIVARYGYMEEVKQDDAFVRVLLERVLHLLLITLQERASAMPTLHHDLGLPASHKVPPPSDTNFKARDDSAKHDTPLTAGGAAAEVQLTPVTTTAAQPAAAAADGAPAPTLVEIPGQGRSLSPSDHVPEPFLYRNLEEVANKLATAPKEVATRYHRAAIVADEIRVVKHAANQHNVVFILGHTHVVLPKRIPFWSVPRRILLELPFKMFADAFSEPADSIFNIPSAHLLEIGLPYTLDA